MSERRNMFPIRKSFLVFFVLMLLSCNMITQTTQVTQTPLPAEPVQATVTTPPQDTATTEATATETPTQAPIDTQIASTATATAMATLDPGSATLAAMMGSMGALSNVSQYYHPVGTPVKVWQNVPVMAEATAGQEYQTNIYSYVASATLSQAELFYASKASSLGLTNLPGMGSAGSGSQAVHNAVFPSFNLTIYLASYDNDTGHVMVVIAKSP
jgi:hypothetical protein